MFTLFGLHFWYFHAAEHNILLPRKKYGRTGGQEVRFSPVTTWVHITNKIIKVYLKRENCELSFNPALSLSASTTATMKMTFPFENDGNSIWYLSIPVPHSGLWYLISPLLVCNITAFKVSQMKNTSKTFHITAGTYYLFNFFRVGTEVSCF